MGAGGTNESKDAAEDESDYRTVTTFFSMSLHYLAEEGSEHALLKKVDSKEYVWLCLSGTCW